MRFALKLLVIGLSITTTGLTGVTGASAASPQMSSPIERNVRTFVAEHPGTERLSGNTVSVEKGHYITFSQVTSRTISQARADCPSGAYCWFDNADWGGAIEWYSDSSGGCGAYLSAFRVLSERASSWVNNSGITINTVGGFTGGEHLYYLNPYSANHWVGSYASDYNDWFCVM